MDENGNYYRDSSSNLITKCFFCNQATSRLEENTCVSCKPLLFANSISANIKEATCLLNNSNNLLAGGLIILNGNPVTSNDPTYFSVAFGSETIPSSYYQTYLLAVYRTCTTYSFRNVTACVTLGNLCVLNLYNRVGSGVDACTAFNSVPLSQSGTNLAGQVWGYNMPWLLYAESYGIYKASYLSFINSNKPISLSFAPNKCQPQGLLFYAAVYALNGTLLSFGPFNITNIQLCICSDAYF